MINIIDLTAYKFHNDTQSERLGNVCVVGIAEESDLLELVGNILKSSGMKIHTYMYTLMQNSQ